MCNKALFIYIYHYLDIIERSFYYEKNLYKKGLPRADGLTPPVHAKIEEAVALLNFYYGENGDVDK